MNYIYIYLWAYIAILFWIALYIRKRENTEDFLISGRDRNWWQIMFSKFAWAVWVAWFLSYTAYAYDYWFWVYIIVLGFLLGYSLLAFWVAPKIHSIAKENKFYTQWDLIAYRTKSQTSKKITDIFSSIIQWTWLLISTIGWAKIIESLWLFSYEWAALIVLIIVLSYILLWWYKVVLLTDIFQWIIIITLLLLISCSIIQETSITQILTEQTGKVSIASLIGFFLYWTLVMLALSDRYQLCYAAKDKKSIQKWMFFTAFPILIMASLLLLIGLFMHMQDPNLDSSIVFLEAMKNYMPSTLLPLWIVLFFAWLMSSADTSIYSISSHLSLLWKKENSIRNIKIISILLIIFIYIVAYFFSSIIWVTVFWAGLSIVMSVPMIYIVKWWTSAYTFTYTIITWLAGLFIWIILFWLEPSIIVTIVLWGLLGLLFKKRKTNSIK